MSTEKQIFKFLESDQNQLKLKKALQLKSILTECIFLNIKLQNEIVFEIPLSNSGQKLFNFLKKRNKDIKDDLINFAIFIDFYNNFFHIDLIRLNIDCLEEAISQLIINDNIKFIWVYGRNLYDKYFEEFNTQKEDLNYQDTIKLLENTPKGVFQIDDIIISPLGLINSNQKRNNRPRTNLLLWHCPDPSCQSFHNTDLHNSQESTFNSLMELIDEYNYEKRNLNLENHLKLAKEKSKYYDSNSLNGLLELLANCFGEQELKLLLEKLASTEKIRNKFPKKLSKGSISEIVALLSKEETLSLILIAEDLNILRQLENLIDCNAIKIPSTEIRQSHILQFSGNYHTYLQCNKLGIRTNSDVTSLPNVRLKKLIKDVNDTSPYKEQFEWKLRNYPDSLSFDQKISKYINDNNPFSVIKDVILAGPSQLQKSFNSIPGNFTTPINLSEEESLVEKFIWKLGFKINLYPPYLTTFWKNLHLFKQDILSTPKYNENDVAKIRSSGVNFFVSIEEILQQALSFITWALLSDHYKTTKFQYVYEDARQAMFDNLNNFEYSLGKRLTFDPNGKNTLYPLVQGFSALSKICKDLIEDIDNYKRPKEEFPDFHLNDPLSIFPFEHNKLILDISSQDFEELLSLISIIPTEFGKGDVLNIRNKLQHNRSDFPLQTELLECVNSIEKSFAVLENSGICPNVYLFNSHNIDKYNRMKSTFVNYNGNQVTLNYTSELAGCHLPSLNNPLIFLTFLNLGQTNQPLMFQFMEKSKYQEYWKDFPRKKKKT